MNLKRMKFCFAILPFLVMTGGVLAGGLKVAPGGDAYLFAGRAGKIQLTIDHEGGSIRKNVEYRIFQSSSATLAPVHEKQSLGEREFPQDQSIVVSIWFTPPQIRTVTLFVAKIFADAEEIGSVPVTVVPPGIFSRLTSQEIKTILVKEPEPLVGPVLEEGGIEVSDNLESGAKLGIVRLPNLEAQKEWRESEGNAEIPVLFIIGRGVAGAEKLLPVKFLSKEGRRIALVQEWFIPDLKENALSQLRLLRTIQLLHHPEAEPTPLNKEKN